MNRDSSVGIVMNHEVVGRGGGGGAALRERRVCPLSTAFRPAQEPNQPSAEWVQFFGYKAARA
jgi:hypothetical protein